MQRIARVAPTALCSDIPRKGQKYIIHGRHTCDPIPFASLASFERETKQPVCETAPLLLLRATSSERPHRHVPSMGCAQSSEVESLRAQVADLKATLKEAEAKGVSLSHQVCSLISALLTVSFTR